MFAIKIASTERDILSCWNCIFALRPMLEKKDIIALIKKQRAEGYNLLYIEDDSGVQAIAGYRIFSMLHTGKQLYIDDLSTLQSSRGKGYGTALLQHIYEIAKKNNCKTVQLDSGPTRTIAHKLYLNENFTINSLHFGKML